MSTPEYFHAVNDRSTLRQLISFMLEGVEAPKPEYPINEGILECAQALAVVLDSCADDVRDNIIAGVSDYLTASEQAYMKLGMQAGFRLAVELLYSNDMQPIPSTTWKNKVNPSTQVEEDSQ